ncbi:MAG: thiamine pyrophosphate-dependent enzyme [Patescibacteria group bacterium]
MATMQDFSGYNPTWCPGCGDFGIGISIKQAFVQLGYDPSSLAVVFGIGCSGNMNDFLNAYAIHSLHGRSIPNAIGIKLANHKLPVVAIVGDGDCYGEGGNHLLHAARGNHDLTVVVHDNGVYGLTTGQVAPTSQKGYKSKSTPSGIIETPINPLSFAITSGASFVAQSFAGDAAHLSLMIKEAIKHKGFSVVNVLQPCVTFNKINTYQYYMKRVYKLPADYDPSDFKTAVVKSLEMNEEKFPLGIVYKSGRPAYHEQVSALTGEEVLINKKRFVDFETLVKDFV